MMRCVLGTPCAGGRRGWALFARGVRGAGRDAPRVTLLAAGDALCATLFAGGVGGVGGAGSDAPYATVLAAGIGVAGGYGELAELRFEISASPALIDVFATMPPCRR